MKLLIILIIIAIGLFILFVPVSDYEYLHDTANQNNPFIEERGDYNASDKEILEFSNKTFDVWQFFSFV